MDNMDLITTLGRALPEDLMIEMLGEAIEKYQKTKFLKDKEKIVSAAMLFLSGHMTKDLTDDQVKEHQKTVDTVLNEEENKE